MGSEGNTMVSSAEGMKEEEERKKVALMRVIVEQKDPRSKEVDDFMIRRFLRARELDINKASTMFLKYLNWKTEFVPSGFISDAEVHNELNDKKMFMQGFDRSGRPIGVAIGAKFNSQHGMDEFKRFFVYLFDKLCCSTPRGQDKFLFIADLQGWRFADCSIRAYLAAIEILQNYYPERLGKVFMIHVPYLFMKAWKMIYPFIDDNTKKKFLFVDDKDLREKLLEDIDESQLPEIYGGKLPLVPIEAVQKVVHQI